MGLGLKEYSIALKDQRSQDGFSGVGAITSGCLVFVYDAGTKTASTIYSNEIGTAKTAPISRSQFATDGKIYFWSAASSHDIFVAHSDGSVAFYAGVAPEVHTLVLNRDGVEKVLIAPFGASDNTETDTGLDLPYGALVTDCQLFVTASDATETIDAGLLSSETAGDANGFRAAASVANTGWVAPAAFTAGSNETYISAVTYGALLGSFLAGSDVAGDVGNLLKIGHNVTGSNAVSLTYTGSSGSDTAAGYIYVHFKHVR